MGVFFPSFIPKYLSGVGYDLIWLMNHINQNKKMHSIKPTSRIYIYVFNFNFNFYL